MIESQERLSCSIRLLVDQRYHSKTRDTFGPAKWAHVTSRNSPMATVAPPLAPHLVRSSSFITPSVQQLCTFVARSFNYHDLFWLHQCASEPIPSVLDRHRRSLRNNHGHKILRTHLSSSAHLYLWTILAVLDMKGKLQFRQIRKETCGFSSGGGWESNCSSREG
jgi:hypothetical protein